ncbi:MAG TPA: hypothetical protein VNW89_01365 [Stellaceae bacterium]|jgi:hypothetical protein|nr:hypothetical protein [Stellaceae bacterium]
MITRKMLRQANAEKSHFDAEKFDSLTDADIDRMIAEDPKLAPPTQSLAPLLDMRDIRRKLGRTQAQLAKVHRCSLPRAHRWSRPAELQASKGPYDDDNGRSWIEKEQARHRCKN